MRHNSIATTAHSRGITPNARAWLLPDLQPVPRDDLRRPRNVAALRKLPHGRRNQSDGAVLSAARAGLRRLLPGAVAGVREAGAHLHRIRVLLVLFDVLGRARAPLLRNDQGPAQSRRQQPGVRDRQQRRISAAALPAARRAGRRDRAGRQRGRGRAAEEYSDAGRILRPDARAEARRRRQEGRPHHRQQRAGAGAGPQRLRRRHGASPGALRRDHARVPASRAADRREPVRHHLSRALLVLLAGDDRSPRPAARPQGVRRRAALDAWRIAARLSLPRRCGARRLAERHGAARSRAGDRI